MVDQSCWDRGGWLLDHTKYDKVRTQNLEIDMTALATTLAAAAVNDPAIPDALVSRITAVRLSLRPRHRSVRANPQEARCSRNRGAPLSACSDCGNPVIVIGLSPWPKSW